MRGFMGSAVVLVALLGAVGCDKAETGTTTKTSTAAPADIGEIIATVDKIDIGAKEFEAAAQRKTPANGESLSAEEKKEVLDSLIEEKLLYNEALRKGLDRDPKVQKVMVNTLVREDVFNTLKNSDFPDEVLQKYYEDHKSEFVVPEKVQVKRILIKITPERAEPAALALAEKVRGDVAKNPDSFKDLAAEYSEDPYKRRGGDVGFVAKDGKPGLDQAIVDKAFTLEVNQVSDVFKTDEGFNVVSVAARREQLERTFQQMKGTVLRKAKNAKQTSLYDEYVGKLKTAAKIQVHEDKLAKIEIKSSRRPFTGMDGEGMDERPEGEEGEAVEGAMPSMPAGMKPGIVPQIAPGQRPIPRGPGLPAPGDAAGAGK